MSDAILIPGPGQPLDPETVLGRDLVDDPPPGWPKLPAKAALLVQHRAAAMAAGRQVTWASSRAAAGMHRASRIVPEARQYVEAMALHLGPGDVGPADLRQMTVQRLAGIVQHGDDREASVAAKVLQGFVPKPAPEPAQDLANKGDSQLVSQLGRLLAELDDSGAIKMMGVSLDVSTVYKDLRFPGGGNGTVQDEEDFGQVAGSQAHSEKPEKRS